MALRDAFKPQWSKTLRKVLLARLKLQRVRHRFGLPPINGNPLAAIKSSDTLFVLGSGGSIHQFTPAEWAVMAHADTVGLNFWPLHDFVPKAYVFEPPKDPLDHDAILHNLHFRASDYRNTLLFLKDGERFHRDDLTAFLERATAAVGPRIVLGWDWELRGESLEEFTAQMERLDRWGILASASMPFPRKRASILYIVLMALRAGYRRIVLCGVDLNGSAYFYEENRTELEARGMRLPWPAPPTPSHVTDDPAYGAVTVSSSLEVLRDRVLAPKGIELMVAFESSRLHPMLPSYFRHP